MNIFNLPSQINLSQLNPATQTFLFLLLLLIILLWLWSLVDVLKRKNFKDNIEKLIWVFVIVSTFFLGTILYYFLAGKKK